MFHKPMNFNHSVGKRNKDYLKKRKKSLVSEKILN